MNLFKALLFLPFLAGCGAQTPSRVMHADVRFTPPERECLEQAAAKWTEQTYGVASIGFEYDYNPEDELMVGIMATKHKVVRWTSTTPAVLKKDAEESAKLGYKYTLFGQTSNEFTDPLEIVEIRMVADRLQDPHICRLTAMHEIGHAWGLDHLKGTSRNIMWPSIDANRTECLKKEDMEAFCRLNKCIGPMVYCTE